VAFDLLAEYNPASEQERKTTRKSAAKPEADEDQTTAAPRSLHPLPLPAAGLGRPPYAGQAHPVNPGSLNPGRLRAAPMKPAPLNAGPKVPSVAPNPTAGGPQ
jgi:hypothetical protein